MAGATVTSFSSALKNVYLPGIREELNEKTNLLDLFTEGDLTQYEWQGNQLVFALHSSRNYSGVLYVAEGGALPVAGSQGVVNLLIPVCHLKGRISCPTKSCVHHDRTRVRSCAPWTSNRRVWSMTWLVSATVHCPASVRKFWLS